MNTQPEYVGQIMVQPRRTKTQNANNMPNDSVTPATVEPSAERRFAGARGYAPWQPPFRYNMDGQWIEDSKGQRMLDMRGWDT